MMIGANTNTHRWYWPRPLAGSCVVVGGAGDTCVRVVRLGVLSVGNARDPGGGRVDQGGLRALGEA